MDFPIRFRLEPSSRIADANADSQQPPRKRASRPRRLLASLFNFSEPEEPDPSEEEHHEIDEHA